MTTPPPDLTARVRKALVDSGLSHCELARLSGVAQPVISRFVADPDKTVRLDTAEKVLAVLGYRLELWKAGPAPPLRKRPGPARRM
jgi:plasmid maintenance system antidote protein VapI